MRVQEEGTPTSDFGGHRAAPAPAGTGARMWAGNMIYLFILFKLGFILYIP
jgi:hypothetical protein